MSQDTIAPDPIPQVHMNHLQGVRAVFFFLRLCSHYVAINWFTLTLAPLIRHFPVVFNVMVIDLTVN